MVYFGGMILANRGGGLGVARIVAKLTHNMRSLFLNDLTRALVWGQLTFRLQRRRRGPRGFLKVTFLQNQIDLKRLKKQKIVRTLTRNVCNKL